jgi:phage protein D
VPIRRPAASLTIDGAALTGPEAALVRLDVELGVGGAHDRFRALVGHASPAAGTEAGAAAEVALGYGDEVEAVLTGTVTAVERAPAGVVLEGLAGTIALSHTRIGRSYVSVTAADVVQDLVSTAGATAGEVQAPLQLAAYHVDERRTAWSHVQTLAVLAACEVTSGGDGALNFRAPKTGPADHAYRYGADLVAWDVGPRDPPAPVPAVVPHGAASEQGAAKWHILLKEPDGGSPSAPTLVSAALRDRDGATAAQDGLERAAERRALGGYLLLAGDPVVRAGDLVELEEMPAGEDGTYRVTSARHLLDAAGFRTLLRVEGS